MTDEEALGEQTESVQGESNEEEQKPSLEDTLKEVVQVDVEEVGTLRKKLTITIPRETLDEQVGDQYDDLRRDAMVPGFRKGRAPRRLLEKRFGNDVSETLVQQLVGTGYMVATEKLDLKVLGDPLVWVSGDKEQEGETLVEVDEAIRRITLPDDGPLVYACEVEIRPEFDLPALEGVPIEKPVIEVAEEDITVQMDRIRAMRGTYELISEGPIEADDLITADVKMTSGETVLKEEEGMRVSARPQQIDGVSLEGLGEALSGAKVGDVKTVSGQIGDDYVKVEFRGQQADFEFTIREIRRMRLPELTEEFIKSLGFDAEAELREWIKNERESRLGEEVRRAMHGQVQQYLLDKVSFDLPERLSNKQSAQITARRLLDLYRQGVPPAEVEKLMDELRTSAREDALRELKLAFIMEKLAEEVEVEVSEEEINAQIAWIAQQRGHRFDRVRDELAKEGAIASLYVRIRDDKIIDKLLEKAEVTEKKGEKKSGKKSGSGSKKTASKSDAKEADAASAEPETEAPKQKKSGTKRASSGKTKGKSGEDLSDET